MYRLLPPLLTVAAFALATGPRAAAQTTFVVDATADRPDADPGDGTCADDTGDCTLRAAIDEANATSGEVVVEVPGELAGGNSGAYTLSAVAPNDNDATFEDDNAYGDLDVGGAFSSLTIVGTGTPGPVVSISPNDRVIDVQPGAEVTFARMQITGGTTRPGANGTSENPDAEDGGNGGGMRVGEGAVVVIDQVTFNGNKASAGGNGATPRSGLAREAGGDAGDGGDGGALYVAAGADVTVKRSNFTANVAGDGGNGAGAKGQNSEPAPGGDGGDGGNGGAIYNAGTLTVESSTVWQNKAGNRGTPGGGANGGERGDAALAGSGGGIANAQAVDDELTDQGTATIVNTIVARNTLPQEAGEGPDLFDASDGNTFSGSHNLIGDSSGVPVVRTDQVFERSIVGTADDPVDPEITGLSSESDWAVPTLVLSTTERVRSPAIDNGTQEVKPDYDARGYVVPGPRNAPDIGAFEARSEPADAEVTGRQTSSVSDVARGLGVFPNPTSGLLTVRLPNGSAGADVELLDVSGRVIPFVAVRSGASAEFDLTDLTAGVYLIRVSTAEEVEVTRVYKR